MTFLDNANRLLSLAAAVYIIAAMLDSSTGFGFHVAFSYHPVMMTIAFVLFITQGVVCYVTDYGETLNSKFPNRPSRRMLHGAFQMCGTFCVTVGYLIAFVSHQAQKRSHIAADSSKLRQAHVWMGYITLVLVFIQAVLGFYKFAVRVKTGEMVYHFHGKIGPLIYALGLVTLILGVSSAFMKDSPIVAATMIALLVLLGITVVVQLIVGPGGAVKRGISSQGTSSTGQRPLLSGDKDT